MKKIHVLLLTILLSTISINSFCKDRAIHNGLSLNLIVGKPMNLFEDNSNSPYNFGDLKGLQLGNTWYCYYTDMFGIGVKANWFDIAYTYKSITTPYSDLNSFYLNFSFLGVGPVGTLAISKSAAFDLYYTFRPTLLYNFNDYTMYSGSTDYTSHTYGFGIANALGTAFRIKVFNIGLEYDFASINGDQYYDNVNNDINDETISVTMKPHSVRLLIGVKF